MDELDERTGAPLPGTRDNPLTVRQFNNTVKQRLESEHALLGVWVRGEVEAYTRAKNGVDYFSLKDPDAATVRCAVFGAARRLAFKPENAMKVIAFGSVSVYAPGGSYSLKVEALIPDGVGERSVMLEQMKARLQAEGLFDPARKKPLPKYPTRIGVVTSPTGKAIHDIIDSVKKRWPVAKIILIPVSVQGDKAPREIALGIRYADKWGLCDVLIVGRGGGEPGDLYCFDEEVVVRAIAACSIPVISAVGHEKDNSVADLAADVRAATPNDSGTIACPDIREERQRLRTYADRLGSAIENRLRRERTRLESFAGRRVLQDPANYIDTCRQTLGIKEERMSALMTRRLGQSRQTYAALAAKLDALSPLKVLGRGYSIALDSQGRVIKSAEGVKSGDEVKIKLLHDEIECVAK